MKSGPPAARDRGRAGVVADDALTPDGEDQPAPHWHIKAVEEGIAQAEAGRFADDAAVAAFFEKWRRAR